MRLSELAKPTEHKLLGQDVEVGELQYNSRKVKAGDVFCCIVGTFADGHAYAAQAVEQGAAALVVERELPLAVPQVLVPNTRIAMAEMAAGYYGYPAKDMTIIGITVPTARPAPPTCSRPLRSGWGKRWGLSAPSGT